MKRSLCSVLFRRLQQNPLGYGNSSTFIVKLPLIRRTASARAQFSGCSSTTNAHSEMGQMAVCCQNMTVGSLSRRSALSVLVGALFKKFGLFLNKPCKFIDRFLSFLIISISQTALFSEA